MGIFDKLFGSGSSRFKTGKLKTPTKFRMQCIGCSGTVTMEIPSGYENPWVDVECSCGKGEALYIVD